ncbi:MAG: ATP synthase subunit a [Parcubacteria group bacterium GW2011_GWE2_39_37]|nr:MAG: ATP synthase subunit a [Parcubacteria group bacterium GW2011_GWE2_39_37]
MSASPKQTNTQEQAEVSHETTLFAEPIAHIGSFTITNSLLTSWITVLILVVFFVSIGRKMKQVPGKLQNVFEILLEEALKLADSVTGARKKTEKFLPITLSLFLFILVNNWLGLLPGFGTIGFIEKAEGHSVFIPLLRGGTADLNTTLAISLFAVVMSHIMGVVAIGAWHHLNKFINIKLISEMAKKVWKEPMLLVVNPIKFFVGIIETIGELAKVASLSFRLFGNIFAGEVLLASMMAIFAYALPLPFIFLEIIVGLVQALVFAILNYQLRIMNYELIRIQTL